MTKLGEVFTIASGGTPDKKKPFYYENGTIPWVKTGDLKTRDVPTGIDCITEEGLNNSPAKLFPPNTVLVAMYGATIGACSILSYEAATNQACAAFLPNENVLPTYLYYFLLSKRDQFVKDGVGGAQPNISAGYLKNVQFDLVPVRQQEVIVERLDEIENLIALRKEQLQKLDELVKARFVELFGDYRINEKGFDCKKGSELFKFSSGKFLPEEKRLDEGVPVYGGNGIAWYTSECLVDYPTIIIGRVGAQCGNIHAVTTPVWITDNAIYIKEQKTKAYTLEFLTELMRMMDFYQYADFSGQPKITQKPLETLDYIMPPIELQNEYTTFVEQTDKSKLTVQQSLDKLELLKKALMQKYFG